MKNLPPGVESSYVSINGQLLAPAAAQISIFDRGFLYGDSVYEVTYAQDGALLFFDEHMDRLFQSAGYIGFESSYTRSTIAEHTLKVLKKLNPDLAYIRIVLTRGISEISLDPGTCQEPNLIIIAKPYAPYPQEWYDVGQSMMFSTYLRNDKEATNPNAKSGNYLNNVLALKEAKLKGFHDAILFNKFGFATEGTSNNIWLVKDGLIQTPDLSDGLLKGITRDKIFDLCEKHSIPLKESHLSQLDFLQADEIFYTSSTKGIVPIYKITEKQLNPGMGPITKKVAKLYAEFVKNSLKSSPYRYR